VTVTVESVAAVETFLLRHEVLGRGVTPTDLARPDDDHPDTASLVVRHEGAVVGTGTVRRQPPPFPSPHDGWQIRGMAVRGELRGRGIGTAILDAILDHVRARGGAVVWCNARIAAVSLYERAGFERVGEAFDDRVAGTQVRLAVVV
jgi:ribosomal protein S18 acetylase RimI-like enzyme